MGFCAAVVCLYAHGGFEGWVYLLVSLAALASRGRGGGSGKEECVLEEEAEYGGVAWDLNWRLQERVSLQLDVLLR